ncbi:SGNH/GDSL hydrolase family protein [Blastopirellula sp. J2-11]|uniref:SGNH/GDSL hydrolase family protein n=1 Tax=Blastopirellula sp. J2-11 TaxID=2943192 RepID=UPI0021CA064D|nr:SGNH/GDSL hydrolase family protein [Blastopirellula sp. J2-11]UUO04385.1 SGNH/GDSL hydrolase family protein [Blastopirellula sp. J2-11]
MIHCSPAPRFHVPRLLTLLAVIVIVLGSLLTAQAEHEGKLQILLLGDSTTEGSIPRLIKPAAPQLEQVIEQLLEAEGDLPPTHVINNGQSGDTIYRFVESGRYDKEVAGLPGIDYAFIRYGINDFARREDFTTNFPLDFHGLIARIRKDHPHAKIVLMTVIPFSKTDVSESINSRVRQVAEKEELPLFDIYPLYDKALQVQGVNALNYRRYPLEKAPEKYHAFVAPYVHGGRIVVLDNELDGILGHLPGWYGDRHPNLAGYNVIAVETAKYLAEELRQRKSE